MGGLTIDTSAARVVRAAWIRLGDDLATDQRSVELEVDALQLGTSHSTVVQRLADASTRLWVGAAFTDLVIDRVEAADNGAEFLAGLDQRGVEQLLFQAGDRVRVTQENVCLPPWVRPFYSSAFGDLGGTFGREVRSPFYVTGTDPADRGRSLIVRALTDTADGMQIRNDEFELVELANGRYLVVLAGVTDLSSPDFGLSDRHRSVRDVDQYAYPSSQSTAVADNRYAELVRDGLAAAGVPAGAEIMIVGHSYGADTALDLAADVEFTSRYRLTHVVAAGYNSQPQLPHVHPDVEVLVLQNHRDIPVIVETAAHGHPTQAVEEARNVVDSLWDFDPIGVIRHELGVVYHATGTAVDAAGHVVSRADDLILAGTYLAGGGATGTVRAVGELSDFIELEPQVAAVTDHQLVDVFVGGFDGAGHHQTNYIDHVDNVDDQRLVDFFASIDAAGYTTSGTSWAVDVSVP